MTNDEELQWMDAWNGAYGIPPDSLTAQRMHDAAAEGCRKRLSMKYPEPARVYGKFMGQDWRVTYNVAGGVTREDVMRALESSRDRTKAEILSAQQRVAARLAAAELDREWYGSLPSDKPGIERAIAAKKPGLNFTYSVAEGVTREDLERAIRSLKIDHLVNLVGPTPSNVKPAISGLLVTAGERRGLTQPAGEGER